MAEQRQQSRRSFIKRAAVIGGAATFGAGRIVAQPGTAMTAVPSHNDRTRGWLRFIWEKATTPDDWGYREELELPWGIQIPRGDINWNDDGIGPHPWWDQYAAPPMLSYGRFDLADSSYPVLLMADQTPAWREVYTRIMDELASRHTSYWAAIDWNTFIGPSPSGINTMPSTRLAIRLGLNKYGTAMTGPVDGKWRRALGSAAGPDRRRRQSFFRGWLNLVLSIYKYVSGDDKWERPWEIAGFENEHFEWTQPRIVEHLHQQYTDHPEGPHCENTKIWPFCNSAAGLGIYLSDQLGVTNAHGRFENWVEFMRDNYLGINAQNEIEWSTIYYDPLASFKVNLPGSGATGAGTAFYLLPQSPEIATQIYEAVVNASGYRDPTRDIRPSPLVQVMAKALGDDVVFRRLQDAAEQYSEPDFSEKTANGSAGGPIWMSPGHAEPPLRSR